MKHFVHKATALMAFAMAALTTVVWLGMLAVSALLEKRARTEAVTLAD